MDVYPTGDDPSDVVRVEKCHSQGENPDRHVEDDVKAGHNAHCSGRLVSDINTSNSVLTLMSFNGTDET